MADNGQRKYNALLSNTMLFAISNFSSKLLSVIVQPYLSYALGDTAVMGVTAVGVYKACSLVLGTEPGRLMMLVELAVAILAAVIVYFVMVIVTRSITAEDLKLIPKGEKIAKLLKMS